MDDVKGDFAALGISPLCIVDVRLEADAPIALGKTPWRNRRVSHIAGGVFAGARLSGQVAQGGGDWSELGVAENGDALTLIDVRSLWRTQDGALIYVSYQGRLVIPQAALAAFRDPAKVEEIDPSTYYFRIAPTFETADPRYAWLNRIVALGAGKRTRAGVRYTIFEIG